MKKITVHSCQYVQFSDLFKGLNKLIHDFDNCGPDFSWGDNDITLVTAEAILNELGNCANVQVPGQLTALMNRVDKLPNGKRAFVNLEK